MLLASSSSSGGSDFLIPNGTFVFELVMFIIVLGIVAKFVLPPLQNAMRERDQTIRQAERASDEGHLEAARLSDERTAVFAGAHGEARSIVDEATAQIERQREAAQARARAEVAREMERANAAIAIETAELRAATLQQLDRVVAQAAARILGAEIDATRHRGIIVEAIELALEEAR